MNPYPYKFHHRFKENDGVLLRVDRYRFATRFNRVYFVDVEVFDKNLYFLKFYLRIHRYQKNKFRKVINDGDAFRILSTCIAIGLEISRNDGLASFGFFGINSLGEDIANTIRYRLYSQLAITYFPLSEYSHHKDEDNSLYILLKNKNINLGLDEIVKGIEENYIFPE